jgi:hypothetical protein
MMCWIMKTCHACGQEIATEKKICRRDVCTLCRADLHCCLNCAFHDVSVSKQCREPLAELVKDKNRANFCDYFVFAESRPSRPSNAEVDRTRKELDDLFKK